MNVAVKRIERYLAARKKRRQLAQAWIHWINEGKEEEAELRAADISSLLEQRAELLEALKESTDMLTLIMEGKDWGAIEEQVVDNQEAIAKAETVE